MMNHLSSIQLISFNNEDLILVRSVLGGADVNAVDQGLSVTLPLFKHYGIYIICIEDRLSLQQIDRLAEDERFPVIVILRENSVVSVIEALRAGADDVFYLETLQCEQSTFNASIEKKLTRCRLLYERLVYRQGLEMSLEELKNDQRAAYQVQGRLLPAPQQVIHDIEFQYSITPSLIVSGDFVDVVAIDDELTLFYLADVSGHGASSALVTVLLKNLTSRLLRNFKRASSYDILSPLKTLDRINSEIYSLALDKHLTIFCGLINHVENTLTYAVGGHHPMPIYKSAHKTVVLQGRGMPVGLFAEAIFTQKMIDLDNDFSLSLFSDGVLDLLSGSSIKEKEQNLFDWVDNNAADLEGLKSHIFQKNKHQDQYPDDITIMSVSKISAGASSEVSSKVLTRVLS
ncbi:PP2C family protein-serine/threonine phosphatase [Neptunomonas antarctica]|uniref:Sigma-B regulation protein RsbU (Phosphoserine phosphatase) n=1 Tax=Neptunomonas antarctica TaxID=619304 RepID=A0A1N7NQ69_9GAMM|nr:SpoIIE family protein phosphatase [Neptunomonas antarctica]SIT00379.1 sigma-B regulation protein RsbU (phosphoserine phosphatase) [Neptunomonas antarctica]